MFKFLRRGSIFLFIALLTVPLAAAACGDGDSGEKPTIVFSDLNWTSAQVQNDTAQFIVEHGYGYKTDAIFGGTLPNFQGLLKGDITVSLEIWLPNQQAVWDEAVTNGQVVSVGQSLGEDWQSSFVIPKYVADQNPGLKSVEDLKNQEYMKLFETVDSRGKARLVSCPVDWACEGSNAAQIEAYGPT